MSSSRDCLRWQGGYSNRLRARWTHVVRASRHRAPGCAHAGAGNSRHVRKRTAALTVVAPPANIENLFSYERNELNEGTQEPVRSPKSKEGERNKRKKRRKGARGRASRPGFSAQSKRKEGGGSLLGNAVQPCNPHLRAGHREPRSPHWRAVRARRPRPRWLQGPAQPPATLQPASRRSETPMCLQVSGETAETG
jgi:hypothetical protein